MNFKIVHAQREAPIVNSEKVHARRELCEKVHARREPSIVNSRIIHVQIVHAQREH